MQVSPIYSFGSTYHTEVSAPVDKEYEEIKEELQALGLSPTGNKLIDEDTLTQVKAQNVQTANPNNKSSLTIHVDEATQSYFQRLLDNMGISATGILETDVLNASNQIKQKLLSKSISVEERLYYLQYKRDLDEIITRTGVSVGIFVLTDEMKGATQLGEENKQMLVA